MWHLSGLIYLSLHRRIVPKALWQHLGERKQRKRGCLRYLSPQIFIFTLSACKSELEKQFREAVNKRWWKWKMQRVWPIWFLTPTHIVRAYMTNYLSRKTKIINPAVVPIFVILREKTPCCTALHTVPARDIFIRSWSSLLAVILMAVLLSVRSWCWSIRACVSCLSLTTTPLIVAACYSLHWWARTADSKWEAWRIS